jgi:type I restriction-modification system DNA methylase subunit
LKDWRSQLYKSLRGFNPIYSPAQVDEAVLRIINRMIFVRTTEDRQVEPNRLLALLRELEDRGQMDKLNEKLVELFREFDQTYNSELFARHFSEELYCDRPPLENLIRGLYEKNYVYYNFNALDADVLGTAYEQYLGHMVAESEGETHVEEKRKKRKSQGIYYTPAFVTKYIVEQTVGCLLEEDGYNPSKPPRVLDMACGSGSFLIEAFDVIDAFVAKLRGQAHGERVDIFDRARQLEVLQNCIFGVDKDAQAVEVARLNLLLRALHSRERLPMLENIHNGDSLHSETWEQGFTQIMKEGGFDVIIGNPPYVRIQTLPKSDVDFYNQDLLSKP